MVWIWIMTPYTGQSSKRSIQGLAQNCQEGGIFCRRPVEKIPQTPLKKGHVRSAKSYLSYLPVRLNTIVFLISPREFEALQLYSPASSFATDRTWSTPPSNEILFDVPTSDFPGKRNGGPTLFAILSSIDDLIVKP